jgi:predicted transcriptional regulator
MRTHVVLPEDLVKDIDEMVGPRKRSKFVEEAVREEVRKRKLLAALEAGTEVLSPEEHPEWATTEDVVNWVRNLRQQDNERLDRVWRKHG